MDPAKESPLRAAVELQGAMLGRHDEELSSARLTVDALVARVTQLTGQLQQLQMANQNTVPPAPATAGLLPNVHKPRINNPPVYAGEPTNCRSFIIQCEVVFSLQARTYASDRSRVAYIISLLAGWARDWGAAVWESQDPCCDDFKLLRLR